MEKMGQQNQYQNTPRIIVEITGHADFCFGEETERELNPQRKKHTSRSELTKPNPFQWKVYM